MLYWVRRHEEARAAFREALELDPSNALARFWMAFNEVSLGDLDAAMAAALGARKQMGNTPTCTVGYVHAVAGRRAEALEVLEALEAHRSTGYVSAIEIAIVHVGLGQPDEALDWLERGLEEHSRWMEIVAAMPLLDPLHGHPRFTHLLRTMNLPDPS